MSRRHYYSKGQVYWSLAFGFMIGGLFTAAIAAVLIQSL